MKLWLVMRTDRAGYDEYDSFVAAAETEDAARGTHPTGSPYKWTGRKWADEEWTDDAWPAPDTMDVREIGTAGPNVVAGVVIASFNAG